MKLFPGFLPVVVLLSFSYVGFSPAQDYPQAQTDEQAGVVSYPASFFGRYQPNTALDMVNRVPGFIIDNGGTERGFGSAAGNILINDRRPSTKQDSPSAILGRISADNVERIEFIRVKVRGIDLLGQTSLINVILREDAGAAVRWESYVRFNSDYGVSPFVGISLSDHWQDIDYNIGLDLRFSEYGDPGVVTRYSPGGTLIEIREDGDRVDGYDINGYINASTWLGQNFVQLNARAANMPRDFVTTSALIPQLPVEPRRQIIFDTQRSVNILELGLDGERSLRDDLQGKAIFLYSREGRDPSSSQLDLDANGIQTRFQEEDEYTVTTEIIGRLEFDWGRFINHAIQVDLERALNILDNELVFTDDTGAGPVVVDVPGGNARVEEVRWNLLVQDTWSRGNFDLEFGVNLERSTITQTGDSDQERSFSYIKPRLVLTWSPVQGQQTLLRLEREVSQLDFNDFVTATVFEDNNVIPGNPDLKPDRTWVAELSHERRFGAVGVIKLTGFHHWIDDVLDLLPFSSTFEATGNIGDGRRWGLILSTTIPLDWAGIPGARLDFRGRLQDSSVMDPVTGQKRILSGQGGYRSDVKFDGENRYSLELNFRQDLEEARVSWGWGFKERDRRSLFKANELDIFNEGFDVTAFIETTHWYGLKFSIEGENLMDNTQKRNRTFYVGERGLTPVRLREFRSGDSGSRIFLKVSGSFQ